MKSCRKCKKGSSISGFSTKEFPLERVAALAAGGIGAKLVNLTINKVPALQQYLGMDSKYGKYLVPIIKMVAGYYAIMKTKNTIIQDAGLGTMVVGSMELAGSVFPQINIGGIGYLDDLDQLSGNIAIDLDQLTGFDDDLEDHQEVAGGGHVLDNIFDDQVLAGHDGMEVDFSY